MYELLMFAHAWSSISLSVCLMSAIASQIAGMAALISCSPLSYFGQRIGGGVVVGYTFLAA
jgi:hypothetical protein